MAKDLKNTIKVDNEEYNINAVVADRVSNKLTVKATGFNGQTLSNALIDFDGDEAKTFEIVPTTGGKFNGPLRVFNADHEVNGNSNIKIEDGKTVIAEDAVLNYRDIREEVINTITNTSSMATWDGEDLRFTDTSSNIGTGNICGLSIIEGYSDKLDEFISYNNTNRKISAFIYVTIDGGNLYLGKYGLTECTQLSVVKADTATKLAAQKPLKVNLASEDAGYFDGDKSSETLMIGVTDTLPVSKGGTGETNLRDVTVGNSLYADSLANKNELIVNLSSGRSADFYGNGTEEGTPQEIGVKGILSVSMGGTGKTNLQDITVGKAASAETVNVKYMTGTPNSNSDNKNVHITISHLTPEEYAENTPGWTGGSIGDIWIKYNNN